MTRPPAQDAPAVFRAPMRSRRDDVDPEAAVRRALALGLCGMGRRRGDARAAARVERFAAVPDGSFVWTRTPDGLYFLGRLSGPLAYDDTPEALQADLVHVRPSAWAEDPVFDADVPPAVARTFGRGGRNFQQIHHPDVRRQTRLLWERIGPSGTWS